MDSVSRILSMTSDEIDHVSSHDVVYSLRRYPGIYQVAHIEDYYWHLCRKIAPNLHKQALFGACAHHYRDLTDSDPLRKYELTEPDYISEQLRWIF